MANNPKTASQTICQPATGKSWSLLLILPTHGLPHPWASNFLPSEIRVRGSGHRGHGT